MRRQRPHVVCDHIALAVVYREDLRGVEERYFRVAYGVVSLALHRFVLLPVVEEQVVQKPRPRGGAGVKMELPAEQEVVVGYVQAVL